MSSGTLVVANSNALGLASAGTFVGGSGTLAFTGGIAVGAETLSVVPSAASRNNTIVNLSGNNTFGGNIVQSGTASGIVGVSTTGSSTLALSGNVTLTGDTLSVGGTGSLYFNGKMSSGTTVSLTSGILGGSGTVASVIDNGGIVNPGIPNSPGTLTVGNLTLGPLGVSLDLTNITSFDSVTATGPVNISGSTLAHLNVGSVAHGEIFHDPPRSRHQRRTHRHLHEFAGHRIDPHRRFAGDSASTTPGATATTSTSSPSPPRRSP